jgi:hypothetical protein
MIIATTLGLAAPLVAFGTAAPSETAGGSGQPPGIMTPAVRQLPNVAGMPDEAAMVLVGTVLIGAAAVVRRTA